MDCKNNFLMNGLQDVLANAKLCEGTLGGS